jgi:redox-sensitive bicupin YhaK (pirin superfamily)
MDVPFTVRNEIELHDIRLDAGVRVSLPQRQRWHVYLFVYQGTLDVDGVPVATSGHALVQSQRPVQIQALETTMLVSFLVDPEAKVTRAGTIGR